MKEYNDYELLYMISENNEEAEEILYNKYRPIVEMKASRYLKVGKKLGLESNDLIQEGLVGLNDAIKKYDNQKDTLFYSFANMPRSNHI